MPGIIPGSYLGGVVTLLSKTDLGANLVRRRWLDDGTANATGESEGRSAMDMSFEGLVSSATRQLERGRWGEIGAQDLFIRASVVNMAGDVEGLKVGDLVFWLDRQLEIKEVKPSQIHGEIYFLTARAREVQGDGER